MEPRYHSFLVRLWTSGNSDPTWHISLESSQTGEKKIFANLDCLHDFFDNLVAKPFGSGGNTEKKTVD